MFKVATYETTILHKTICTRLNLNRQIGSIKLLVVSIIDIKVDVSFVETYKISTLESQPLNTTTSTLT